MVLIWLYKLSFVSCFHGIPQSVLSLWIFPKPYILYASIGKVIWLGFITNNLSLQSLPFVRTFSPFIFDIITDVLELKSMVSLRGKSVILTIRLTLLAEEQCVWYPLQNHLCLSPPLQVCSRRRSINLGTCQPFGLQRSEEVLGDLLKNFI